MEELEISKRGLQDAGHKGIVKGLSHRKMLSQRLHWSRPGTRTAVTRLTKNHCDYTLYFEELCVEKPPLYKASLYKHAFY